MYNRTAPDFIKIGCVFIGGVHGLATIGPAGYYYLVFQFTTSKNLNKKNGTNHKMTTEQNSVPRRNLCHLDLTV